jgi:hypothetical protein
MITYYAAYESLGYEVNPDSISYLTQPDITPSYSFITHYLFITWPW